ncbi:MAG: radical SAM protein [Candidatus Hydrogenedentes bacterium]|nr:radical SAM protein [Candidatus Hydrogenedentota bacterium]
MKIVFVMPSYELVKSYGGGGVLRRGILPPLGVGYLAASAEAAGHTAAFVDAQALNLDEAAAVKRVLDLEPDAVGISCLTQLADAARRISGLLKEARPGLPVIMGGPHVTSFFDSALADFPGVDILVPGEGEETLAELLGALEHGRPLDTVKGLLYRGPDGRPVTTPVRPPLRDQDLLPHPARHIYEDRLYAPLPNQCRRRPATTVITSRGCPYGKCRFCFQGGCYAAPYSRRSPENVVDELRRLAARGIREVIFWDDNFCINGKWVSRFCDLLDGERLNLTWTVFGRVNTVTEEMLRRMARSGCYNVYYGFESGNQGMLDAIRKGITLDQARQAVKWAKAAGMEIRGSFIFAMPGDTPEIAEETIRFACELNIDWMIFYPYHPSAGTALGDLAALEGTLVPPGTEMHQPVYVPKGYRDAEQVSRVIRSAYRRYYLRPRYIARALWRARNPVVLRNYWDAFRYWLTLVK